MTNGFDLIAPHEAIRSGRLDDFVLASYVAAGRANPIQLQIDYDTPAQ